MITFSKLNIVPGERGADRGLCSSSSFFSFANISSFCAQFKENYLGFLLLKDGNNLGILFDSLIGVPAQFCLRGKTANLDANAKYLYFSACVVVAITKVTARTKS